MHTKKIPIQKSAKAYSSLVLHMNEAQVVILHNHSKITSLLHQNNTNNI